MAGIDYDFSQAVVSHYSEQGAVKNQDTFDLQDKLTLLKLEKSLGHKPGTAGRAQQFAYSN